MRHRQWDEIMGFLDGIYQHLGASIHDKRCNKSWDVGQAICAEAYGPDWMHNPEFIEFDQKSDSEPPEPHFYDCAKKMASGYRPKWVRK